MQDKKIIWLALCSIGLFSGLSHASDSNINTASETQAINKDELSPTSSSIKDLKNIKAKNFKVDANAAQPDEVKDPLQPLNRKVFAFNDVIDRTIVRPIAVQYQTKIPSEVRGSHQQFRSNLGEPWNAVNQTIQGRPLRALKTLGRFTFNTITTLGLADPARRIGLDNENESFGTTLGYYGVSSGPYVVLPIFGPSTIRDGFGLAVDAFGRPQNYLDKNSAYWADQTLRAVDARSQLLDLESVLQGDKYSAMRDIYLQRKNFVIAEKKGLDAGGVSFIDDVPEDDLDDSSNNQ
ncbi:VacJ family lipoprotein [Acinetobacter portensis]|uniref:VacJ family lipoprotein n=2 Tax=Acinetobacter TaxID=469 RepID=A0ABU5GF65_9GAMM|nr:MULTISPECIES: VacJ family lipoprotein [Acinetobacter]MCK7608093.1 VacJ family lipoprotein [Acinetobacter portensis]MCK7638941.1 VacJ family lipoprotein [Acinetobacter portensis]MDY6457648.1 VacJ family lipoprotein [Acinetobacter faecalis]MDY6536396.1 VacJ family lipoprotein [Acinetobacter faecalis]MDY6549262.1 VacJ family lipoprotein [Acinetobacter faecalis]